MELPSFAPFPPPNLKKEIVPEAWEMCIDAWILLAQGHLLLTRDAFSLKVSQDPSVVEFLSSYVEDNARHLDSSVDSKSILLKRSCYLLVHRCLTELKRRPPPFVAWQFLSDLCILYAKSPSLNTLLQDVWQSEDLGSKFQKHKSSLTHNLENAASKQEQSDLGMTLERTAALLKSCPDYGQFLMLGSDFIDALSALYDRAEPFLRKRTVVLSYRCFSALMHSSKPKFSMLLDHLYALKSSKKQHSLLSALCSSTPFVRMLRDQITGADAVRGEKLIRELSTLEGTGTLPPKRNKAARGRADKGKGVQRDEYGHGAFDGGVHVHKMSLVTQVQDLFPDLGSAFVIKLLDEYDDDIEQVTAHLLDESLPPHLQSLDRSETMYVSLPLQK
ncbi:MAG: hypothetical protein Q9223_002036 [Gallowayella weberi]